MADQGLCLAEGVCGGFDPALRRVGRGQAQQVPVLAQAPGSEQVRVRGRGLQAGDWVVAAGGHLLRDGEPVAPVDRDNAPVAAAAAPATPARAD